jgi:putative Holliday junction resolvase
MAANLSHKNQNILALDVGEKRIGLAIGGSIAKLPTPIETIANDDQTLTTLSAIISRESIDILVVGIPRNQSGEETAQSASIRSFGKQLADRLGFPVKYADESLSSHRADEYLSAHPSSKTYQDSLAAVFILDEYFGMMD